MTKPHIEKGIAIPKKSNPFSFSKKEPKFPFLEMAVGDSFFVPADGDVFKTQQSVLSSSVYHGTKIGAKFTTRQVTENGIVGVRCWRIS